MPPTSNGIGYLSTYLPTSCTYLRWHFGDFCTDTNVSLAALDGVLIEVEPSKCKSPVTGFSLP